MIDLRDLQLFLHLSETLHFGHTSEAMHVSPSTLSRVVQRLEQESSVVLFERDNRAVRLTTQGILFKQFANQTIANWQDFKKNIMRSEQELKGKLKVFCSVTASYSHLPPLLNQLADSYPNIDIQLATGDASQALHLVTHGDVDIAISAKPDKIPSSIAFSSFDSVPISIIGPDIDNKLSLSLKQNQIDWQTVPFIIPESGITRTRCEKWFKQIGIKPNIYATVAGHEAIVAMTALGLGVGIVPNIVLSNSPVRNKVSVLKSNIPLEPFDLGVCCLNKHLTDPLVNAFWQLAKQD